MQDTRTQSIQEILSAPSATSVINTVLQEALEAGASDIHLNPDREGVRVRMRVDGMLQDVHTLPVHTHPAVLSRIKILSGLRTDEHFTAQDGRFTFVDPDGHENDVRVSIAPTYYGENAVLRILVPGGEKKSLRSLGCRKGHQLLLTRALEQSSGMILATGPTGSGKTTLLYTLLQMLDSETRSIVTLEDPIEYSLPCTNQIPVNTERGLTFANGLRSVLRQDPDIIMVGEIRDEETARLAVHAALTGHLVLSTLHTNDAVSAVPRLQDIGIEPYLIASTVRLVIAQRLVRRMCTECKEPYAPEEHVLERIRKFVPEKISGLEVFFKGRGCIACRGTGYRGRVGVFEVFEVDEIIRTSIEAGTGQDTLRALALSRGMLPLLGDGLEKVRKGITTIDEIVRASYA